MNDGNPHTNQMSRRNFLRTAVIGGVGAVAVAGGAGAVALMLSGRLGKRERVKADIVVPRAEVPSPGAAPYRNPDGHFFLINNPDGALALYWRCTHQGCAVRWRDDDDRFECPCHASFFDRHGVVTGGPAPRPLDLMRLSVNPDGDVIVNTRDAIARDDYTPDQAEPVGGA